MIALVIATLVNAATVADTGIAASATPSPSSSSTAAAQPAVATSLPDGTYVYRFAQGTSQLGTSMIAVSRSNGVILTHEVATLGNSFTVDLTLDPSTFVPRRLDAVYPGAKPTAVHATFGSASFDETISGVPGSKTMTPAAGAKGILPLDGPVLCGFFIAAAESQATGSSSMSGISAGSEAVFPVTLAAADPSSRPKSVPASDAGFTAPLPSGALTVWYDPSSKTPQDMEIPAQGISITLVRQTAQPAMNATPSAPTPLPTTQPRFESRDVVFRSADGTRLAGILTIPHANARRLPAVVLVHGSGPVGRDEQVGPNPIFLELSNALSNHGYIVLRYDKRGVGASGGNARTVTRDQLLADARSAIAFVRAQPGVDPKRVFVVGHSEGGELAPSLAAQGAPLRGIALMAPPAIPLDQILLQQATYGLSGKRKQEALAAQQRANAAIRTGIYQGAGAAWLRSSFGIDPIDAIKEVPCPILVLQGGKDFQVLAKDLPRLVDAARSAHRDITVRVFPNDDHLFITVPSGRQATFAEYFTPHRIDPAMVTALLAWLGRP